MAEVLVLLEEPTRYQKYVFRHVLERMLGWSIAFAAGKEELRSSTVPRLVYGGEQVDGAFHLGPFSDRPDVPTADDPGWVLAHASMVLGTWTAAPDRPNPLDKHGRVSMSGRSPSRLSRPMLDEEALALAGRLRGELSGLPPVRRTYRQIATLDVDNGFKYLGRPLWRTLGSTMRDVLHGRFAEVRDRINTLTGSRRDPYDIYDDFRLMTDGNAARVITNFLVAPRGEHDHAVGLSSARMLQRMRDIARWSEIGLHPSYHSSTKPGLITSEKTGLENAIGRSIGISRQHFLRFRYPETFQELERIGIKEEHSAGLHDTIGFRAETCTPFPFYDRESDRETDLMIHPFQVMDSAMAYYLKLSPDEAIAAAKRVIDSVKAVQGTFIGVWHERFLSDHGTEKGWRRVVEEVIRYAKP